MGVTGIGETCSPACEVWRNPTAPDKAHMRVSRPTAAPCAIARSDSDEAIHLAAQRKSGLLRFARNDGEIPKRPQRLSYPRRRGIQFVGWVERSDTHQGRCVEVMGFASLYPSYADSERTHSQYLARGLGLKRCPRQDDMIDWVMKRCLPKWRRVEVERGADGYSSQANRDM
jgi:hypothetical protein